MDSTQTYDVVVIGAGPGGYVAAIRAAQLDMKTALVEKEPTLGGTCLNVGCIPSKALLASSEHFHFMSHEAPRHGILADNLRVDFHAMQQRKEATVRRLTQGIASLMRKNGIHVIHGNASLTRPDYVQVAHPDGHISHLQTQRVIIATGSKPAELPPVPFNGETVVSSTGALAFREVPRRLVIAGAGAIGLEMGSVYARLGSEVRVVEFLPHIAAGFDADLQANLQRALEKLGITFHLNTRVTGLDHDPGHPRLHADTNNGEHLIFDADKVLIAIGRIPCTDGLFADGFDVAKDKRGRIIVDENYQTNHEGLYAIGDVIPGPMLAHKAEEDGVACIERIAGIPNHFDPSLVPGIVYTSPEAASVGLDEATAREQGIDVTVSKFPFLANGRALANGNTEGFVKLVCKAGSGRILGAHILSPAASELIAEVVAVMEYRGCAEDLARTTHAHPTLSEAVKEAALAAEGRAIHF